MKLTAPLAILAAALLGHASLPYAGDDKTTNRLVDRSEVRTKSDDGETRERHRSKSESRQDKNDRSERSGHRHGKRAHGDDGHGGKGHRGNRG